MSLVSWKIKTPLFKPEQNVCCLFSFCQHTDPYNLACPIRSLCKQPFNIFQLLGTISYDWLSFNSLYRLKKIDHTIRRYYLKGLGRTPHLCLPYICPFKKLQDILNIIIAVLCLPVWPTLVFLTNLISSKWLALQNFRVELFYASSKQVDW